MVGVSENSAKRLVPLPSTIGGRSFLPALSLREEKSYPKQVFTGKSIDQVYGKNQDELVKLQDDNKQLKAELNQIKLLNEKLTEKVDDLQSIIKKEASANTYYFNYPPKDEGGATAEAGENKPAKA